MIGEFFAMDLEVGRKPGYSYTGRDEPGKNRTIYVSDPSWKNIKTMAAEYGMSISLFIDSIGSGEIKLEKRVAVTPNLPEEHTDPPSSENLSQDPPIAVIPHALQSDQLQFPLE
jgi:hypothetical protein